MKRARNGKNRIRRTAPAVPSEKDWGSYQSDLDQTHAHTVFATRTNAEMQSFFRRNPIEMTSELRWMPEIPFRYYMLGFRDFIMAGDFDHLTSSDAASCFLGLVREKLEREPRRIVPIMAELMPAVEHVSRNQVWFQPDGKIYGSFLETLASILALYEPYRPLNRRDP